MIGWIQFPVILFLFKCSTTAFGFTLTALLPVLTCTISTSSMDDDFDCLLAPVTESWLSPFLFKKFDISTARTFSHVYICTRHINKDQYWFYALYYFDFTLFSSTKITSNLAITKIESMTGNYLEFRVANINYAGHQI